jgi:antirestriction protein ArdC
MNAGIASRLRCLGSAARRVDRDLGRKRFADAGYTMEELVAEIGAAFLCADLGIAPETRDDHAAYIASWLKVLKDDKRAIFTAASHAQNPPIICTACSRGRRNHDPRPLRRQTLPLEGHC